MRLNEVCPHCKKQTATFWVRSVDGALYKCIREKCGRLHEREHPRPLRAELREAA